MNCSSVQSMHNLDLNIRQFKGLLKTIKLLTFLSMNLLYGLKCFKFHFHYSAVTSCRSCTLVYITFRELLCY